MVSQVVCFFVGLLRVGRYLVRPCCQTDCQCRVHCWVVLRPWVRPFVRRGDHLDRPCLEAALALEGRSSYFLKARLVASTLLGDLAGHPLAVHPWMADQSRRLGKTWSPCRQEAVLFFIAFSVLPGPCVSAWTRS